MAAAHEQRRIYEVLVKAYNDLVELKELAGEATEQDVMDKVYKAWSCVVRQHGVTRTTTSWIEPATFGSHPRSHCRCYVLAAPRCVPPAPVEMALQPGIADAVAHVQVVGHNRQDSDSDDEESDGEMAGDEPPAHPLDHVRASSACDRHDLAAPPTSTRKSSPASIMLPYHTFACLCSLAVLFCRGSPAQLCTSWWSCC